MEGATATVVKEDNTTATTESSRATEDRPEGPTNGLLSVLKLADNKYNSKNKKKESDDMSPYALIGYAASSKRTNKGEGASVATPVSTRKLQEDKSEGLVETEDDINDEDIVSKKSDVKL